MAATIVVPSGREQLTSDEIDERIKWTTSMRFQYSPPDMLQADGTINQDFFKPKKVVLVDDKKWGPAEKEALYKGLEKYGIGKWKDISEEFLPKWEDQAIRVKASKLMGSQSLARYAGWSGNRDAVDAEQAQNKAIGEKTGCWKAGVLVEDDAGSVKQALEELKKSKK